MSPRPKKNTPSIRDSVLSFVMQHPGQIFSNLSVINALKPANPNLNSAYVNTAISILKGQKVEGGKIEGRWGIGEIGYFPDSHAMPARALFLETVAGIEQLSYSEGESPRFSTIPLEDVPTVIQRAKSAAIAPVKPAYSKSKNIKSDGAGAPVIKAAAPAGPGYTYDTAQISKNKDALLQRYRDFDTGDFTNWWSSLREPQTPEGTAIRYMEKALEGLRGEDRKFVSCYLAQILCNPNTYDSRGKTYRPRNPDFRKAAIVSDVVKRSSKDGSVPDEIYAAMQMLSPEDNRTTYIWGESLRDKGLGLLRDIGMQKDPESACQVTRGDYKIFLGYDA